MQSLTSPNLHIQPSENHRYKRKASEISKASSSILQSYSRKQSLPDTEPSENRWRKRRYRKAQNLLSKEKWTPAEDTLLTMLKGKQIPGRNSEGCRLRY
ncbi:hypothetical protein V2W45_1444126 [Cenococcum geophilum]